VASEIVLPMIFAVMLNLLMQPALSDGRRRQSWGGNRSG